MIKSKFFRIRPNSKIESFYRKGRKEYNWSADCICNHCNTVSKAIGCFHHYCPSQEVRLFLTEEHNQRGKKKRELDELQQKYTKEKGLLKFRRRILFAHYQLCEEIRSGELLSFVQYVMKFRKYLQLYFVIFPPIFKNISVDHNDNGKLMKQFAKKELPISISDNVNFMFQFAKRTINYLSGSVPF